MIIYFKGGNPYHIDDDGNILVNNETLSSNEHYWSSDHSCRQIENQESVEKFLGHKISDYKVTSLFERLAPTWLQGILEVIGFVPKRK